MAIQIPLSFEFRANQTFDSFYPGNNLEIVHQLEAMSAGDGEQQILIWGESGCGKTHLLQACCQHAQQAGRQVFYLQTRSTIVPAILEGLEDFDLVCLDDIHHIAGHPDWEQTLFNFYNRLRQHQRQLLIASNAAVNQLPIRLPDLKTRLNWGLSLKIQNLSDEQLIQALQVKAHHLGFEIPDSVGRFLLSRQSRDFAELYALLEKIDTATLIAQRKLTIPFLKQILAED